MYLEYISEEIIHIPLAKITLGIGIVEALS